MRFAVKPPPELPPWVDDRPGYLWYCPLCGKGTAHPVDAAEQRCNRCRLNADEYERWKALYAELSLL